MLKNLIFGEILCNFAVNNNLGMKEFPGTSDRTFVMYMGRELAEKLKKEFETALFWGNYPVTPDECIEEKSKHYLFIKGVEEGEGGSIELGIDESMYMEAYLRGVGADYSKEVVKEGIVKLIVKNC